MSTRCNIRIKDNRYGENFILYHHSDGYPSGVGMDLKRFLNKEKYWHAYEIANKLIKGIESEMYGDVDYGYYVTSEMHGDINYLYVINCSTKELICYRRDFGKKENEVCRLENIVNIEPE